MKQFLLFQFLSALILHSAFANPPKIDSKGRYLPFPGVTIVSTLPAKKLKLLQELFNRIRDIPLVTDSYSLLPITSYHMTTLNLYSQHLHAPENWPLFIENKLGWFETLRSRIETTSSRPQGIVFGPHAGKTLQLVIHLDPAQQKDILQLATHFHIVRKIPPHFHITLGYAFKEVTEETRNRIEAIVLEAGKELWGMGIEFNKPQLCYFFDMTEFIPWKAVDNPFSLLE